MFSHFIVDRFEQCNVPFAQGLLPADCEIVGGTGGMVFNNTACDNTLCTSDTGECNANSDTRCCCQVQSSTSFSFQCPTSDIRTIVQPTSCTCRPCEDLNVTLIFAVTSGSNGSSLMGASVEINDGASSLVTNNIGTASIAWPVNDEQVSVVVSADNHLNTTFTVLILPPGPSVINVVLPPVTMQLLGSGAENLTIPIGSVAIVDVPANTIVDGSGNMFDGNVTVQTVFFAVDGSNSYSNIFPREVAIDQGTSTTFYQSRVIARTLLFDGNGAALSVNPDTPFTVVLNFTLFDENMTLSLLLFNDQTGSWTVDSNFTTNQATPTMKRQVVDPTTAAGQLSNSQLIWAVGLPIDSSNIVYLQVRINSQDTVAATIDVEQVTDTLGEQFFFRSSRSTGDGSGPITNSLCIEVLLTDSGNGTIQATTDQGTISPSMTQPTGFTITPADNTVAFMGSSTGGPIYTTAEECMQAGNGEFVSFEPPVAPPTPDLPPETTAPGFWYIQVQVLSCFDSNRASTISVANQQASIITRTATAIPGTPIVPISTDVNPLNCTGTVTARTVCLQAFPNTEVTIQAELNAANPIDGDFCYLRAVSDQIEPARLQTTDFKVQFDFADVENTSQVNDPSLGIYFDADSNDVALMQCLSSVNQPVPLEGSFVRFECFERKLTIT